MKHARGVENTPSRQLHEQVINESLKGDFVFLGALKACFQSVTGKQIKRHEMEISFIICSTEAMGSGILTQGQDEYPIPTAPLWNTFRPLWPGSGFLVLYPLVVRK